jgi:histidinol-phosphatase (PHP family)
MLFDNHNHSEFSFDAPKSKIERSTQAAIERGLGGICFTDHYDFISKALQEGIKAGCDETFDIKRQQEEIDRVQMLYPEVKVLKGIELGLEKECREDIKKVLAENSFDQVIASIHYIDDTDPYHGEYYLGKNFKQAYGHYLETLYTEMTWFGDFDVMGHYDYITRYPDYPQESILYKDFPDEMDSILRYLSYEGKALEINTKTYQTYRGRTPICDINILKRYHELGGEIISLGSDSHNESRVAEHFDWAADFVRSAGFRYLAHFENRKLIQTPAGRK